MTRRPVFWVFLVGAGLAGAATAWSLFTTALPNVSIEIDMDRSAAMAEAAELDRRFGWSPADARAAASFGQADPEVQTFVELEGGGRGAFQELVDAGVYQPYQWRVRRFAEGEVREVEVRFTPSGEPYGFSLRLADDDPGDGDVDEERALELVREAAPFWGVDLASHRLLESSQQERPGGRTDHTFVFERSTPTLGDGRFRVRFGVAGDRVAEVTPFVFVPEAFERRYAQMRSTNESIALAAQAIFILLYVILGAGVGTALLLRSRWIEWRTALAWGALTAVLFGLNSINALPLAWMGYDTALSASTFVFQNVAAAGGIALLGAPMLAFFFLAGESLGRRAFPGHLQQWRFWSDEVASSRAGLGLTVAAYALVGIQLGYVVLFYLGTSTLEGWWSPSDALVQPDLLATYQPWLQAVSLSLFASLWEESIFRAVPIACAALLGARFGRRQAWVWIAVVVQAVVFAAGHANYPQQPPYARVLELFLPAFVWGVVYVRHGLVPTIIAHFLYDLALISSVLFASGAFVDQGIVVLVGAVPLLVVLHARWRAGAFGDVPAWAYNRAWSPTVADVDPGAEGRAAGEAVVPAAAAAEGVWGPEGASRAVDARVADGEGAGQGTWAAAESGASVALPGLPVPTLALVAAAGVAAWAVGSLAVERSEPLSLSRGEAIEVARAELERLGHDVAGWTGGATTADGRGAGHEYVHEALGPDAHTALTGSFLAPPQWIVRFVDWAAPPEERVEEFVVNVAADGGVRRVAHTLPEARPGARLSEDSARAAARGALPPGSWEDVGAEESVHEARTDWLFTFRDSEALVAAAPEAAAEARAEAGSLGEARASVVVQGDEVTDVRRYVDVPEEWERARRDAQSRRSMLSIGVVVSLVLLLLAAAITGVVVWSRGGIVMRGLAVAAGVVAVPLTLSLANGWPATTNLFDTSQPYGFQVGAAAIGIVLVVVVGTATLALVVALAQEWAVPAPSRPGRRLGAVAAGALLAGASVASGLLPGTLAPPAAYGGAAAWVPLLSPVADRAVTYLVLASSLLLLGVAHRRFQSHALLRSVTIFAILAVGFVAVPDALQTGAATWAGGSALAVAVAWLLARWVGAAPSVAPLIVGAMMVLGAVRASLAGAYPGAGVGEALAAVVLGVLAWRWSRLLEDPVRASPAGGRADAASG